MSSTTPIDRRPFGKVSSGEDATLYTLRNARGTEVDISDFGATVVSFRVCQNDGSETDIVMGHDTASGYEQADSYMGATIGRFANRLGEAKFELDGKHYPLAANNGPNHLHGGLEGFDKRIWQVEAVEGDEPELHMALISEDGDQGYPGRVDLKLVYRLDRQDGLHINIVATTTQATPLNITNHSYFNLLGAGSVLDHRLTIFADHYTPMNAHQIPTGEIAPVADTPLDFREPRALADDIDANHSQIAIAGGYDHNYVLRESDAESVPLIAKLESPSGTARLDVYSDAPGVQLYSGNFLDGSTEGKGVCHERRSALCLEPQGFPDAPNKPEFPSAIVRPEQKYRHHICYRFVDLS